MKQSSYYQPDTCIPGKQYYIKTKGPGSATQYKGVKFISYRPHPAEVLIREDNITRVIHRIYLLQKNGRKQEGENI